MVRYCNFGVSPVNYSDSDSDALLLLPEIMLLLSGYLLTRQKKDDFWKKKKKKKKVVVSCHIWEIYKKSVYVAGSRCGSRRLVHSHMFR